MKPNAAPGMAVQALAGEIVAALKADGDTDGYDIEAGLFGPKLSELVRRLAAAEFALQTVAPAVEALLDADMVAALNGGGALARHVAPAVLELRKQWRSIMPR